MAQRTPIEIMAIELFEENRSLTIEQARIYAMRIFESEAAENFVRMNALVQEAIYGDVVSIARPLKVKEAF